jgi:ABC-type antimicrobial peptide transport system permease subunit
VVSGDRGLAVSAGAVPAPLAGVAGRRAVRVIGLLIVGQLLARRTFLEATDYGTLRALGMSRTQLMTVCLGRAAATGAAGGLIGAALGVALSPLLPVCLARTGSYSVDGSATPTDLLNFGQVRDMPQVVSIGLAVVALLTIAHLLMTSVQRRHRDFAILRALGFTSWQVRGTLCRQALTLAGITLPVGIPAGIACGRLR